MKISIHFLFALLLGMLQFSEAQNSAPAQNKISEVNFPLKSGARLVLQRTAPPDEAPRPVLKSVEVSNLSDEERKARRAKWLLNAPLEYRLLSILVTLYPNGLSHLSWYHVTEDRQFLQYEAWSNTDFSSLSLVGDFELKRVCFMVFPTIIHSSARFAPKRSLPGPLKLELDPSNPGFLLIKGDPKERKAMEAVEAIHQIYREEGPTLAKNWLIRTSELKAAEELQRRTPVLPPQDVVIKMWPSKSRRYATIGARH
jgi:hypothetical protein